METVPEGFDLLPVIVQAFQSGRWDIFVSAIIMALVWIATKTPLAKNYIKGKAKVWTAAVAGVLASFATTIFISDGDWFAAISNGVSVGLGATGLFELIRRSLQKQPIDADGDGELDQLESK